MKNFKLKDALGIGLSTAALGVSSANLATNIKRNKENRDLQTKQLKALNRLSDSLDKVDITISRFPDQQDRPPERAKPKRRGLIRFFQKSNSHTLDYAGAGAVLGGTLSAGVSRFLPPKIGGKMEKVSSGFNKDNKETFKTQFIDDPSFKYPGLKDKYNKSEDQGLRSLLITIGGAAIGATLGAIAGAIMDASEIISRKKTVNARLMKNILENLRKSGRKDGEDYTRDPRRANLMKTKVCLVISRSADTLKLLVNTVNDYKLKSISDSILKNLPSMSTATEKASDKFNELSITTISTNDGDSTWVASIADRFISAGYPVYLVEVG